MIFPHPYTKSAGLKLGVIIGYSTTYNITPTTIDADFAAGTPRAVFVTIDVEDDVDLLWFNIFGKNAYGYPYVLFPNANPAYPTYEYRRSYGTLDYTELTPSSPSGGDTYWGVDDDFDYDANGDSTDENYTLYKRRGFSTVTVATFMSNQTFSVNNPTTDSQ